MIEKSFDLIVTDINLLTASQKIPVQMSDFLFSFSLIIT